MIDFKNNDALVEKLSLQVNSFQEGFKILSDSKNLKEIGEKFLHLLRGNLLLIDVNLFYKKRKMKIGRRYLPPIPRV